jgi:hypothetical protein
MNAQGGSVPQVIYWHRELPPRDAELLGTHTVEATSEHVPGMFTHRDALWQSCYDSLMANAHARLSQEVARLGGQYAHVFDEAIDSRRDDARGEAWLHGRFDYTLFGRPSP